MIRAGAAGNVRWIKASELFKSNTTGLVTKGTYYKKDRSEKYEKNEYHIRTAEGELVGVNASGNLDYRFEEVPLGSYVEVTYLGKEALPEGHKFAGTMTNQWQVDYDIKAPEVVAPVVATKSEKSEKFPF